MEAISKPRFSLPWFVATFIASIGRVTEARHGDGHGHRLKSREPGSFKGLLVRVNLAGWRELRILAAEREIQPLRLGGTWKEVRSTPKKRTSEVTTAMSALGQRRTFARFALAIRQPALGLTKKRNFIPPKNDRKRESSANK